MSVGWIGTLYGLGTLLLMFSGMPIAFALGGIAVIFMFIFMPGCVAGYDHAERLRRNGQHHAVVGSSLHPQGCSHRQVARRCRSVSGDTCLDAQDPGRTGYRQRLRECVVRGHVGLKPGHLFGHRQRRYPGDASTRLFGTLRCRHHRCRRHARYPAAAVHRHDPVRGCRRTIAGEIVPGRHRPGNPAGDPVLRLCRISLQEGIQGSGRHLEKGRRRNRPIWMQWK